MSDKKVTNIKYKQMDRDPKIKENIDNIGRLVMGESGVGLLDALGLTPGRIQKHLDDEFDKELERVLTEHNTYIMDQKLKRTATRVQDWLNEAEENNLKEFHSEELTKVFAAASKEVELEVITELLKKEGLI